MPESKALAKTKEHSKSIAHNTIGSVFADYLIKGGPSMIGWLAAVLAYMRDLPLWLVIVIGSGLFLILSTALYLIEARRGLKRMAHDEILGDDTESNLALENKKQNDRIKELEQGKTALEVQKKQDARIIERLQKSNLDIDILFKDRDSRLKTIINQYGWLHKMADEQAKDISKYIEVRDGFSCYDRSPRPLPRLLLGLHIYNKSVFDVFIEPELQGCISLDGGVQLFDGKTIISSSGIIKPSTHGSLIIEQRLSPQEFDLIANYENGDLGACFYFNRLIIMVTITTPSHLGQNASLILPQVISHKDIRK